MVDCNCEPGLSKFNILGEGALPAEREGGGGRCPCLIHRNPKTINHINRPRNGPLGVKIPAKLKRDCEGKGS